MFLPRTNKDRIATRIYCQGLIEKGWVGKSDRLKWLYKTTIEIPSAMHHRGPQREAKGASVIAWATGLGPFQRADCEHSPHAPVCRLPGLYNQQRWKMNIFSFFSLSPLCFYRYLQIASRLTFRKKKVVWQTQSREGFSSCSLHFGYSELQPI